MNGRVLLLVIAMAPVAASFTGCSGEDGRDIAVGGG